MSSTVLSNPYYIKIYNFEGIQYRLANNWLQKVNIDEYKDRPIKYLEIGTFLVRISYQLPIHMDYTRTVNCIVLILGLIMKTTQNIKMNNPLFIMGS